MGKLLLISLIIAIGCYSLRRPYVGILAYYLLAILGPQYIWFWNFSGLRVSYYVAVSTLAGVLLAILTKRVDYKFLNTTLNRWLAGLWAFVVLSYLLGPFVPLHNPKLGLSPSYLLTNTNNIFLFYFCSTLIIDNYSALKKLALVLAASTVYLIYWANYQYFTSNWAQFSFGRLKGPESVDGGSIYRDENAFAMLFVTGIPFIYYLGQSTGKKWIQMCSWGVIVFGWHAVFLTGSRGGLIGLSITILILFWIGNKKWLAFLLIPAFFMFYSMQGGDTMKDRAASINQYEKDSSSQMRIIAWKGGMRMIAAHPVTGVGIGSFITALPQYIETSPRVAHNTFIQFAAESGVGAGLCYLMVVTIFIKNFLNTSSLRKSGRLSNPLRELLLLHDAASVSFVGLVVCSLFLSLNNYEIFYFLLIFTNTLSVLLRKHQGDLSFQIENSKENFAGGMI